MGEELRAELGKVAQQRAAADQQWKAVHDREKALIAQAWREQIHPTEIAAITGLSPAHIRNLRPADVPPLRMGGGAAPKKRRPKKRAAPPNPDGA